MPAKNVDKRKEINGILYLAASLIFAVAYYLGDTTGMVGATIRNLGFGFIGITAYAIPAILFYMAMDYFLERESRITRRRFVYITVLLITAAAIVQVFSIPYETFKAACIDTKGNATAQNALINLWKSGIDGFSGTPWTGGFIGGGIAYALVAIANKVGAVIILIAIAISEMVLVFNISVSHAITKTKDTVDTVIRQSVETIKENNAARKAGYDMVVGETKEKKTERTSAGFFHIPEFLKGEEEKENAPDTKKANVETENSDLPFDREETDDTDSYNDDYANDTTVDLPAGVKRIDTAENPLTGNEIPMRKITLTPDSLHGEGHADKEPDNEKNESVYPPRPYIKPSIELLNTEGGKTVKNDMFTIQALGKKLEDTLSSFGIAAKVVNITNGPVITRFELSPGPGVKVSKIVSLSDDIALNLAAIGVRIEAPIPGKSAIGIEIPNKEITPVMLRRLIESPEFKNASSPLAAVLGRDIPGNPVICDLAKMPHLLIAGATGSGKSVCINSILISILFKASPDEVKMLMIDPKVVELSAYNGIPHLLAPVVTNPKKAANTLIWAVNEMNRRYALFAEHSVRDVQAYNGSAVAEGYEKLPLILLVIDELSDLMATTPTEVEDAIARLTAMARAAGIHLVIATQRPSVDVITGVIKANIPSRIAFAVSSQVDSRTILDYAGAEKLLGKGDMLYYPIGAAKSIRAQGAFVTDKEVERVTAFLKNQNTQGYDREMNEMINATGKSASSESDESGDEDEMLPSAVTIIVEAGYASISLLQRRMNIGYPRAARLIDRMQEKGFVGAFEGSKPRKVLITQQQWAEYCAKNK